MVKRNNKSGTTVVKFHQIKFVRFASSKNQLHFHPKHAVLVAGTVQDFKNKKQMHRALGAYSDTIQAIVDNQPESIEAGQEIYVTPVNEKSPHLQITILPEDTCALNLLEKFRTSVKRVLQRTTTDFYFFNLNTKKEMEILNAVGVVLATTTNKVQVYGKRVEKVKKIKLETVHCNTNPKGLAEIETGHIEGLGTHMVRDLGMVPANELTPKKFSAVISNLCQAHRIKHRFIRNSELKKMGAGAFTAVDQGDPESHGGIWILEYKPTRAKNKKPVALVGKGLCFDTGGYDIKKSPHMVTMKGDMIGAAVVLATLVTAARLKLPIHLKGYLALTENHISPKSFKPDDVVIALNGMSIEIVNTDAEGRMVLADTLTLATKESPEMCIDFATLTGAALYAIGKRYSAGLTNDDKFHASMIRAGKESGERVWPFPLDPDFGKALESPIADILQCLQSGVADHINAAFFLSKFVNEKVPWVHIDLSGAESGSGLGPSDTLFSGFGVRWALNFLRHHVRLSNASSA
jgi:leucyl aminopeptidase